MSNCSVYSDREREARTNLFVLAALRSATAVGPVRIRNVSQFGMLVEGATIPANGTAVEVERGSAIARGQVVWTKNGRAGIKLTSGIDVQSWLPRGCRGQLTVDEIVFNLKSGQVPSRTASTFDAPIIASGESELGDVATELESVTRSLIKNEQVVEQFPEQLQRIDIVVQRLRQLAKKSPFRI